MSMNKEQSLLLELIKKSQFGSSEQICWDDVDMQVLYEEAKQQAVLGLVAYEIPEEFLNSNWQEVKYRSQASYIRYCYAQDELKRVLDDADIPFVILKGNASALNYKYPSRRTMGDIDFLTSVDCVEKAKNALITSGYIWDHNTDRHASFKKDSMSFELHNRFSHDINLEDYIIEGLKNNDKVSVDAHEFPMLPTLANGLVLLDHFREHLKFSVGLRHVIDWMMYTYRNLNDDFWNNKFKDVADEKGLDVLAISLTKMCQIYLGLPKYITWCSSADINTCEQLMSVVLNSGNFGRKNHEGYYVEKVSTNLKRKGLFPWLQFAGEHNWKAYHKHHWLKPFCWFYQIFRYIKQGFMSGRNKNQLKDDLKRSNDRYELLKKLKIDNEI